MKRTVILLCALMVIMAGCSTTQVVEEYTQDKMIYEELQTLYDGINDEDAKETIYLMRASPVEIKQIDFVVNDKGDLLKSITKK